MMPFKFKKTSAYWEGDLSKAYDYRQKLKKAFEARGDKLPVSYRVGGYILMKNGIKNEAEKYFDIGIKTNTKQIEFKVTNAQTYNSHANLADIYSALGKKIKRLITLNKP